MIDVETLIFERTLPYATKVYLIDGIINNWEIDYFIKINNYEPFTGKAYEQLHKTFYIHTILRGKLIETLEVNQLPATNPLGQALYE